MRSALIVVATLALGAVLFAQQPPPRDNATTAQAAPTGTAAIAGIVLTTERTPQPIRRATVTVTSEGVSRTIASDEDGKFQFSDLPPGRFTVTASRPGYVRMTYGALRYDRAGTPIVLTTGQRVSDVRIALPQGAVITGLVNDEKGLPARAIAVRLYQYRQQGDERTLVTPPITAAGGLITSQTDDLGAYRLYGLPAGDYVVSAAPTISVAAATTQRGNGAASPRTYAPVFYPGTPVPSAATIVSVVAGEERGNVDIPLMLVSTASVSGRVLAPAGSPRGTTVRLTSAATFTMSPVVFNVGVTVGDDGQFSFTGVAPGDYTVAAVAAGPPAPFWGRTEVSVNGTDLSGLAVSLQPTVSLSGRVVFEDGAIPADLASHVRVGIRTGTSVAPTTLMQTDVRPNGQFRIDGIVPAAYHFLGSITSGGDQSWSVASATAKGADALDLPVEIAPGDTVTGAIVTFTRVTQEVSGVLQDAAGRPTTEFTLIVFPADRAYWDTATRRTQIARPGTDGRFLIRGLPPGDYFIAAVTDLAPNDATDPSFLDLVVPGAVRFTLKAGEKKTQDFKLGGNP